MKKSFKIALSTLFVVVLVVLAALISGSCYMIRFALAPDPNRQDVDSLYQVLYSRFPDMPMWVDSLQENQLLRDTFVVMPTSERHHALYLRADSACGKTAVIVHGYKDFAIKFLCLGRMYHRDLQYNILLPDLHAHGFSEGDAIQMGWKDADDVVEWIRIAEELFRCDDYPSRVVVHGVSMGAATTMNVSGKELPDYVCAFVEDCGFTSVWDEFSFQLQDMFGLPSFPLLDGTNAICQLRYGWSFREASPIESVSRCSRPMLFIHGDADTYVPFSMLLPLYEAKPEPKAYWIAPGSAHAVAYRDHPEEYTQCVRAFLQQWM